MIVLTSLVAYQDERGNEIVYSGRLDEGIDIKFVGSNNRLVVAAGARLGKLQVRFDCSNGLMTVGASRGVPSLSVNVRVGQDSRVRIGKNVSSTSPVIISATEGTTVTVGDDVMFASGNQLRADDGHAIFDVKTGERVNKSRSIRIGHHVWLSWGVVALGGAKVGDGSVLGYGSVVTHRIPNNCVAVGIPARVVRRDIAWERPHLSLSSPYYKPDASTVVKGPYWNVTEPQQPVGAGSRVRRYVGRTRIGRVIRRSVLWRLFRSKAS